MFRFSLSLFFFLLLLKQRHHRDAEEICRKVLSAEPQNSHAKALIEKAREGKVKTTYFSFIWFSFSSLLFFFPFFSSGSLSLPFLSSSFFLFSHMVLFLFTSLSSFLFCFSSVFLLLSSLESLLSSFALHLYRFTPLFSLPHSFFLPFSFAKSKPFVAHFSDPKMSAYQPMDSSSSKLPHEDAEANPLLPRSLSHFVSTSSSPGSSSAGSKRKDLPIESA